jgi:hypothetical protein
VARNCEVFADRVLSNLDRLAGAYTNVAYVFGVSDCQDNTRAVFEAWLAKGHKGRVLDLGDLAPTLPLRTARIAFARNACLEAIEAAEFHAFEHVVVVDMDDVLAQSVSPDAFVAAGNWLDARPERAAVFANAAPLYYDIWALRHDPWCPADCWRPIWDSPSKRTETAAKLRELVRRQVPIPADIAPIPVRSAFGGLAIYKRKFVTGRQYKGTDALGREVCEHVAFNEDIGKSGGQLHIFTPLVVAAPVQHLCKLEDYEGFWPRLAFRLIRFQEKLWPRWKALARGSR